MKKIIALTEEAKKVIKEGRKDNFIIFCDSCDLPCDLESSHYPLYNDGHFDTYSSCCCGAYDSRKKRFSRKYKNPVCGNCREVSRIIVLPTKHEVTECCGCEDFAPLFKDE